MARATYDAIWDWDVERNSLEWNDGTKSFFGYEPDIVGSDLTWWIENIHPEDRTRVVNSLHAVIESGASIWSSEYQFRCYDGTYAMVLDRGYVVHDDTGKAIRMVGAMNDITERKQAEEAFQESNERLRELNLQLSAAEEAERKGIARELHDQFGQTLTLLKFEISELADGFPKNGLGPSVSAASDKLQSITALVDSTINSVRNITSFLRPPILDDFGLVPALEWLSEDLQERTHLQCSISIDPQLTHFSFNEVQTTTLFRIAQELLTNVIRHANASEVKLGFKKESNAFILDVCDNGQGIREEILFGSGSFGLRGIRERAWLLGGHFTVQGQPGKGTTATVRIPIDS